MANANTETSGRLSGAKSPSYVRAVNEPEARASRFVARYMLASDVAYVLSAAELGYTPPQTARNLLRGLLELIDELAGFDTSQPPGDVVAQRERWIAAKVKPEDAAWLHLGRNRGESLRVYLPRLFFRQTLYAQRRSIARVLRVLAEKAEPVLELTAPNYHHLQHSGISTLGEYLLSWASVFAPHLERMEQVERRLDCGPPSHTSRRELVALFDRVSARLGFSRRAQLLQREAIWTHEQFTEPFFCLVMVAVDLARLAQDVRIWSTKEFGLFELADQDAGGSSNLPHAKVPFGLQAVIGGAAIAATRLAGEMTAAINPSEGSEPLYQSASLYQTALDVGAWTEYIADVVEHGAFDEGRLRELACVDYSGSSEAHARLVYDFGVPFRTAHRVLGKMVRSHYYEEPFDLGETLKGEGVTDVHIDDDEILKITLAESIPPTTFDPAGARRVWGQIKDAANAAQQQLAGESPVDGAIDRLLADARALLDGGTSRV